MGEERPSGGGSFWANPNALLALMVVVGGLWLVSQRLTSDRPAASASGAMVSMSAQKLDARLWEDPFKIVTVGDKRFRYGDQSPVSITIAELTGQICEKTQKRDFSQTSAKDSIQTGLKDSDKTDANAVLLLPVLLAGGQYSEDRESRIRSRFAIVSALGQSGYAPDEAERIGVLRIPWLSQAELEKAKEEKGPVLTKLWSSDSRPRLLGLERCKKSSHIEVRYEWYRHRVFFQRLAENKEVWSWVLVLWLDESCFEDDPLLRLALLLERLTDPAWFGSEKQPGSVKLIGPRYSSTLRAMLNQQPSAKLLEYIANPSIRSLVGPVLQRVDLFCATPSVMDEVLVIHPEDPDNQPRTSARTKLTEAGQGLKSFHNLAATDSQLAREVIDELRLRGAGPGKSRSGRKDNHVVLISEWDTFYGRMLSLTYGFEMASHQGKFDRATFIDHYVSGKMDLPEFLHSFVYLRGLDGQTLGSDDSSRKDGRDRSSALGEKSAPASVEDFRRWTPDVNKAEGQAQFDYLGRLGDQIEKLQEKLENENGRIKAIGIVGSDVYDTLLILQALRQRFPAALFFTTDLDVRFLHPLEHEWAHNLIVVSAYGLALHPKLQGSIAPFRDSAQTAQYAAALAALGNYELADIVKIPPRRFEVGNGTAVDLSLESSALITSDSKPTKTPILGCTL